MPKPNGIITTKENRRTIALMNKSSKVMMKYYQIKSYNIVENCTLQPSGI
jgi:hypothetical protein